LDAVWAGSTQFRFAIDPPPSLPQQEKMCGAVKSGEGAGQGMPPLGENTAPVQYSVKKGHALSCRVGSPT